MKKNTFCFICCVVWGMSAYATLLPKGVYPEWELAKAWKTKSASREKICINGLWRFRSAELSFTPQITLSDNFEKKQLGKWEILPGKYKVSVDSSIKYGGKSSMKVDFDLPEHKNFYHLRKKFWLPANPNRNVIVSGCIKTNITSGYIFLELQTRIKGKLCSWIITPKLRGKTEWKTYKKEFTMPPHVKYLTVYFRNYGDKKNLKGTVWLDNFNVTLGSKGVGEKCKIPGKNKFGYLKVPGDWCGFGMVTNLNKTDPNFNKSRYSIKNAWYQREVVIPKRWKGKKVFLDIGKLSTEAEVFVGTKHVGQVSYMGEKLNITKYVKAGENVSITILVKVKLPGEILGVNSKGKMPIRRGIQGDVFLVAEPVLESRLKNFLVETKFNPKRITVRFWLTGKLSSHKKNVKLVCEISKAGKVIKQFSKTLKAGIAQGEISAEWRNPEIWDIKQGKLYKISLSLVKNKKVIDQTLPEEFGFREFCIKGKYFYLNGKKINLSPTVFRAIQYCWASEDAMRRWLSKTVQEGHNFVFIETMDNPGCEGGWINQFLKIADEAGVLTAVTPPEVISIWKNFDDPLIRKNWEKATKTRIYQNWNHPSLVLWRMNMNFLGYEQYQHPLLLDGSMEPPKNSSWGAKKAVAEKAAAWIEKLDPTRKTYQHAGGNAGNIYCINSYLCRPQTQDVREYLKHWAAKGTKPLMMGEFDLPYPGTMIMTDPSNWWKNEPVMAEYGAIMLGEKSYTMLEKEYPEVCKKLWDSKKKRWLNSYLYFCCAFPKILDECASIYYSIAIPYWRAWGISGGMNSWENASKRLKIFDKNGSYQKMVKRIPSFPLKTDWKNLQKPGFSPDKFINPVAAGGAIFWNFLPGRENEKDYLEDTKRGKISSLVFAPVLAFIAGPVKNWTNQDHTYYVDKTVEKSIIIVNDLRKNALFDVNWKVQVGTKKLTSGKCRVTVNMACSSKVPIKFKLPKVLTRSEGKISAQIKCVTTGQVLTPEPFYFKLYPALNKENLSKIDFKKWALYDPCGITTNALNKLGVCGLRKVSKQLPKDIRVLIIGREALNNGVPAILNNINQRVKHGLQILFFEQTAKSLREVFNLRSFSLGTRQVWIRDKQNKLINGFDNSELRDWNGTSSLTKLSAYPSTALASQRNKYVWTCSNQGTVAATVVEKPHIGNIRPIVDCEFDLRYMAMWEVMNHAGRMVFCQMDISERIGKSPVCDKLLDKIMQGVNSWKPAPTRSVYAFGDLKYVDDFLKINKNIQSNLDNFSFKNPNKKIIILCRGGTDWITQQGAKLKQFVIDGGIIIAAGLNAKGTDLLKTISGNLMHFSQKVLWDNLYPNKLPSVFRGIGPGEIYWREKKNVNICKAKKSDAWTSPSGVLGMCQKGKGKIVWVSAVPSDFNPKKRPDLIFSQMNTYRLYTIILNNLGSDSGLNWTALMSNKRNIIKLPKFWKAAKNNGNNPDISKWSTIQYDDQSWQKIKVPGFWGDVKPEWSDFLGDIWYRVKFNLSPEIKNEQLSLYIGAIDDIDEVFVNGVKIGETNKQTPRWWQTPRIYQIPRKNLNYGNKTNLLVVKVINTFMDGGISGPVRIGVGTSSEDDYPFKNYLDKLKTRNNPYSYMRW